MYASILPKVKMFTDSFVLILLFVTFFLQHYRIGYSPGTRVAPVRETRMRKEPAGIGAWPNALALSAHYCRERARNLG